MARVLPVGNARVSSPYLGGYRSTGGHNGTDYAVPAGTRVAAASAGTVVFSGWGGPYGWRVVVDHGNGTTTAYNHLQAKGAAVGQIVKAGQLVGLVGSTGNSTGPHLDFEVTVGGRSVNPEEWLAGASVVTPNGPAPGMPGMSLATTIERTGVRITPVQADEAWENPNQVDITAADSRFGYTANEQRFGMVAEEGRSIADLLEEMPEGDEMSLGDVEWQSVQGKDYVTVGGSAGGAPNYSSLGSSEREIVQNAYNLIKRAGGSDAEARFLASVVIPESGGNPTAVNPTSVRGSNATGLWQILFPMHTGRAGVTTRQQLFDPFNNAKVALDIYREQGEGAWEVTQLDGGRHRKYLL